MTLVRVRETGPGVQQPLSRDDAAALNASKLFTATPVKGKPGTWLVRLNKQKGEGKKAKAQVGSVRIDHLDVHIEPKLPIKRVLFLLGYSLAQRQRIRWQPDIVGLKDEETLVPAFAQMLWRRTDAALVPGVLTGYVARDATSTVLRGRLRETDQLYQSHGLGHPLQVRYDDLTVDIPENQILKAGLSRMLGVRGIGQESSRAILRQLGLLGGVSSLHPSSAPPSWTPSRLNLRYAEALALAELVLKRRSAEHGAGATLADGFLVDMEDVYEDFVREAIGSALCRLGGGSYLKPKGWHLDTNDELKIEPDLVWSRNGRPAAVVDAKYKFQRSTLGGTSEDIYQMIAYCNVAGVRQGHLVYPVGGTTTYTIDGTPGMQIICHGLDLDQGPDGLLTQVRDIAGLIAAHSPANLS